MLAPVFCVSSGKRQSNVSFIEFYDIVFMAFAFGTMSMLQLLAVMPFQWKNPDPKFAKSAIHTTSFALK